MDEVNSVFGLNNLYGTGQSIKPIRRLALRIEKFYKRAKCKTPKQEKSETVANTGNDCWDLADILVDHKTWINDHIRECDFAKKDMDKQADWYVNQVEKIERRLDSNRCQKKLALA